VELEKYLIDATQEVFASMIFIDITPEWPPAEVMPEIEPNLCSLIGFCGDLKGFLAIHCPSAVARGVTAGMLAMEVTELNEDVKDAIGEVANIVAGGLKAALASDNKKIELAIPTTAIGTAIRTSGLSRAHRVMVPFSCPLGRFGVELCYILS
jgi:chemotaxis protein CheX